MTVGQGKRLSGRRRRAEGVIPSAPRRASRHARSHVSSSHWRFRARHAFASVCAPSNSRCDARKSRCDARLAAPGGAHQGPIYHSATVGLTAGSRGASQMRKIEHLHVQSPFVAPAPRLCWATEEVEPGRSECRQGSRRLRARPLCESNRQRAGDPTRQRPRRTPARSCEGKPARARSGHQIWSVQPRGPSSWTVEDSNLRISLAPRTSEPCPTLRSRPAEVRIAHPFG
jgi:hypothetical protein